MLCHVIQGRIRSQVGRVSESLLKGDGSALRQLLPAERVERAVEAEGVHFRDCLYTPLVTLWTFLAQVLDAEGSCRAAVSKLLAWLAACDRASGASADPCAADTGPYCKARQRLPEKLVSRLARETGAELARRYPSSGLLRGRRVKIADGTTASMPDTPENQACWPQPVTQKPGVGFPLVRMVVLLSLSCAVVLNLALGPYSGKESGETALLRTLLDDLEAGDVLLADRYYASYWMIASLYLRGIDSLFRQHQKRKIDFRTGRRLGRDDHVITLTRPKRPEWMDERTYQQMHEQMNVREVRVRVCLRGFRVRALVLVTTLLDAQLYSVDELARVFRCRWHAELDIRSIKQTMHMSVLRCKTPSMVRKEIWMHLLAYNLIRAVMARAAAESGIEPRQVSFAGAVQTINAFTPALHSAARRDLPRLWTILLRAIARHRVGDRPDRCEPRAVKRRAKPIALLTVPREEARRRLARATARGDA